MDHCTLINRTAANLPPCCIQVHPVDQIIFIGTYLLNKDETSPSRTGSIDIYSTELSLLQSAKTESAVLDLKLSPNDPNLILSAHSTGCVQLWGWKDSNLHSLKKYQVVEEVVSITSLVFCEQDLSAVSVTTTDGRVLLLRLSADDLTVEREWHFHDLEVWISEFMPDKNILLSGGDDQYLIGYDTRQEQPVWRTRALHDAGITSILPISGSQALWTGGYDDMLKESDLRNIHLIQPRVSKSMNLGGGVWRLLSNPEKSNNKILACCMYNGAKILRPDLNSDSTVPAIIDNIIQNGHQSMVYGGAWYDNNKLVTCSFYDKIVQTWEI